MNLELNPAKLGQKLSNLLHRYHVVIFVCIAIGGLSYATLLLITAMNPPEDGTTSSTTGYQKLDTETIDRVNNLSTNPKPLQVPANSRSNPF